MVNNLISKIFAISTICGVVGIANAAPVGVTCPQTVKCSGNTYNTCESFQTFVPYFVSPKVIPGTYTFQSAEAATNTSKYFVPGLGSCFYHSNQNPSVVISYVTVPNVKVLADAKNYPTDWILGAGPSYGSATCYNNAKNCIFQVWAP
jgi:hypothetical protein